MIKIGHAPSGRDLPVVGISGLVTTRVGVIYDSDCGIFLKNKCIYNMKSLLAKIYYSIKNINLVKRW